MIHTPGIRAHLLSVALLTIVPMVLLWSSLFGNHTYVPWDLAQFAPRATVLSEAEWQQTVKNDNTDVTEIPVMFGPQLQFIHNELQDGRFPHWDPYSRSGTNLWASSILGPMYPLNWPLLIWNSPYDGFALSAYLTFLIAGVLMYGFLIQIGLKPLPALFGAVAFAFSGTLTINSHFYQRINALIWLPGVLWSMLRISRSQGKSRIPSMLALAMCMFMTMTAGFPPFALVVTFVAVAYTGWLMLRELNTAGSRAAVSFAVAVGISACLGIAAAGIQLLPMAEFFPVSNRDIRSTPNGIASGGFDWYGLLGYLMPDLFSHPHLNEFGKLPDRWSPLAWLLHSRSRWEPQLMPPTAQFPDGVQFAAGTAFQPNYNFCEYTVYVGVVTLLFAFVGTFTEGPRFRKFAAVAIVVLILMASASWWMSWLVGAPPFRWVPPLRYTGPTCMLLAALAAMGLEALPHVRRATTTVLALLGVAVASVCFAYWWWVNTHTSDDILRAMVPGLDRKYSLDPAIGTVTFEKLKQYLGPSMGTAREQMLINLSRAGLLVLGASALFALVPNIRRFRHGVTIVRLVALAVVLTELLYFGYPLNQGRELKHQIDTPVHDFLRQQRDKHRADGGFMVMRASAPRPEPVLPSQLPGGTLLTDRIRDLNAYTFVDRWSHLPLRKLYDARWFPRLFWPMAFPDDERLELPYFDMLGVRFVLSTDELSHAGRKVGPVWKAPDDQPWKFEGGEFHIYERNTALPKAWVVHDYRIVKGGENAMVPELIRKDFRPHSYCLLDKDTADAVRIAPRPRTPGRQRGVIFDSVEGTDTVRMTVSPGTPGFLVLNQTCMPGWTANVNGVDTPIFRCNLFLSMLPLDENGASIELRYLTPGFRSGFWITICAMAVMLAMVLSYIVSRRRAQSDEITL